VGECCGRPGQQSPMVGKVGRKVNILNEENVNFAFTVFKLLRQNTRKFNEQL
jgi:hypothetical protein